MDKEFLRNPGKFINGHLDEVDGVSYSAGDPVNFVDPSEHAASATRSRKLIEMELLTMTSLV